MHENSVSLDDSNHDNDAIEQEEPSWYWDDETAGKGERPEYLAAKFKSVADAAKSYNQLEKKLGSAPKEYTFESVEGWMDPEFEPLRDAAKFAKEKHVSQDVVDRLLGAAGMYLQKDQVSNESEIAKLGDNGQERINVLNNWAKSNFSENTFNSLAATMDTAEAVVAMEEIRGKLMSSDTIIPGNTDASANNAPTVAGIQEEMMQNYEKYKTDPSYRNEIQMKLDKATAGKQS